MFTKRRCEVLVVGAGPVGLYTALRLAANGVDVQIVDKDRRTGAHSYALALHARSLRMLEGDGLADPLLKQGHRVERMLLFRDGKQQGEIPLGGNDALSCVLVLPQSTLENALEDKLKQLKVKVLWNHRMERFDEAADELSIDIAKLDRVASGYPIARVEWEVVKSFNLHAKYMVGADGYHSPVRQQLVIDYPQLGPVDSFSVFEAETAEAPGHDLQVLFNGELASVMWPLADNRCRWSFQIADPSEHESSLERLNGLIQQRAPWFPAARGELFWSSMVQFDRRLAKGMGRKRVWLAGDSVHMTSPVGVQSMNAGLVDGYELAGHLMQILRHDKSEALLESYVTERMRELDTLFVRDSNVSESGAAAQWAAGLGAKILRSIPATGRDLDSLLEGCGVSAASG